MNEIPFETNSSSHTLPATSLPLHRLRSWSSSDSTEGLPVAVDRNRKYNDYPESPVPEEDSEGLRGSSVLDPPRGDVNSRPPPRRQSNAVSDLPDGKSTSKTEASSSSAWAAAATAATTDGQRHRSKSTVDRPQIYFADPGVNRPQVVAPGTVESLWAKMFRQKRDLAPRWSKLAAGQDPSAAASAAGGASIDQAEVGGQELPLKKSGRLDLLQNAPPEVYHNRERRASLLPFTTHRNAEFASSGVDVRPRSSPRGIADFFRFRKKSVTSDQAPTIHPVSTSVAAAAAVDSADDRARLQPPISPTSSSSSPSSSKKKLGRPLGLRRQRSKSTADPPKHLDLQTPGGRPLLLQASTSEPISVKVFDLRRNLRSADLLASSSGQQTPAGVTTMDGQRTPMSDLLSRRISPPESTSGFGIMEFLELYMNHTASCSDLKSGERTPQRQNSDPQSPTSIVAFADQVIDQLTTSSPSSPSSSASTATIPRTKPVLSSLQSDLPMSIPEYAEVHHQTGPASVERNPLARRPSPQDCWRSLGGGGGGGADAGGGGGGLALDVPSIRLRRRFSEPPSPSEQQLNALNSIRMKLVSSNQAALATDANDNFVKKMSRLPDMARSLGLQIPMTSRHKLLLWRDKENEAHLLKLPVSCDDSYNLGSNDKLTFVKLMKQHRCHELIPQSAMLVLLDSELKVISAFYALMFNGIKSAPIWSSSQRDFVGMLTVTDFINVLRMFYKSPEEMGNMEDHKISDWITLLHAPTRPMVCAEPDDSLFEASVKMATNKIHRVLVVDSVDRGALHVLSYKKILQFIYLLMFEVELPSYMDQSIEELNIGTYGDRLWVVKTSTRLIDALNLLVEKRVSALPVVDNDGRVVNIYAKVDAINLAIDQCYKNLDCSVGEALEIQREKFEGVFLCRRTDTLRQVTTWIVHENIHRMIITDDHLLLAGVISLSDIVRFLVIKQLEGVSDFDVQPGDIAAEMDSTL